jgi:hypothetical protein
VAWLFPYISSFIVHILARQACNPVHIELEGIWDYGAKLVYVKRATSIRFFFLFLFFVLIPGSSLVFQTADGILHTGVHFKEGEGGNNKFGMKFHIRLHVFISHLLFVILKL